MFLCSYNTRLTGHPYDKANIKSYKYQQPYIHEGYYHATWFLCRTATNHISGRWLIARDAQQPLSLRQDARDRDCAQNSD